MTALTAVVGTVFNVIAIVGWQGFSWLSNGDWPSLPLSFVITRLENGHDAAYMAAGASETKSPAEMLLELPVIVPMLLASALLTAFYLWLARIEGRIFPES